MATMIGEAPAQWSPGGRWDSPHRVRARERYARARKLRDAGWSYAAIAEEVGYSGAAAACMALKIGVSERGKPAENDAA